MPSTRARVLAVAVGVRVDAAGAQWGDSGGGKGHCCRPPAGANTGRNSLCHINCGGDLVDPPDVAVPAGVRLQHRAADSHHHRGMAGRGVRTRRDRRDPDDRSVAAAGGAGGRCPGPARPRRVEPGTIDRRPQHRTLRADGALDAEYLSGLSSDIDPALARLPEHVRSCVQSHRAQSDPWYQFNLSRWSADRPENADLPEYCSSYWSYPTYR